MDKFPWKTLHSRVAYKNSWITLLEDRVADSNGQESMYGVLTTHPSVLVVAVNQNQEIYIAGQYRYPTKSFSWELPGGNSDNEEPVEAAKRELLEETGITAQNWQKIGEIQTMNGISDEFVHIFMAQDLDTSNEQPQAEEAIMALQAVPLKDLFSMIESDELTDAQSIAAIVKTALVMKWK